MNGLEDDLEGFTTRNQIKALNARIFFQYRGADEKKKEQQVSAASLANINKSKTMSTDCSK